MMLTEICQDLKNWFDRNRYFGQFRIDGGEIIQEDGDSVDLKDGQYFRIIGSIFNDGVHLYSPSGESDLADEAFEGAVWSLAIPKEVVSIANEIDEWQKKYGDVNSEAMSPFQSESFGGYSYSKSGGGASDGSSNGGTWKAVFGSRLNKWRKI